jgi:uncharacterized membrane protein
MNTEPAPPSAARAAWLSVKKRVLGGLLLVLPIVISFWVIFWLYSALVRHVIDPLARLVMWKAERGRPDGDLPVWFETYAAPLIAVLVGLLVLYGLGFLVHTRVRRAIDWVLMRVPVLSSVYDGVRKMFQTLDKPAGQPRPQRVVLVAFPHPGMRVPAFVTSTCRDIDTQKPLLCVYVPTTPVPTSGYFLLVPEEETVELSWTPEEALQAIISGGLTAPPEVRYYRNQPAPASPPHLA